MKVFLRDLLTTITIAGTIFLGLQVTVQSFVVEGQSMNPSFQDGQRLMVNKAVYRFHEPARGDVVIFHPPNNQQDDYIKRIIGLPGESIEIKDGTVYVLKDDGSVWRLDETYIADSAKGNFKGDKIPENEFLVLGDNRNNSNDSRHGWLLPRQNIIGKVWVIIWPPDEWKVMTNSYYPK